MSLFDGDCCRGVMSWPLDPAWVCEYCQARELLWGYPHAEAHCQVCHALYTMRDRDDREKIVTVPQSLIKPEYGEAWKKMPPAERQMMHTMSKEDWEKCLEAAKCER